MTTLDDALIAAHEKHDRAALVALYQEAATQANTLEARCFYLTHAYVFALEAGLPDAPALRAALVTLGAEVE